MNRVRYVLSHLDGRDRAWVGFVLAGALLASGGVGYVTARHQERVVRSKECVDRIEAKARERGYQIIRLAAIVPCEGVGAR